MTDRRYSLPRDERIRNRKCFDRVFKEGQKLHDRPLFVRYAPNDLPFTRIGVATPNRLGKAARRNRARRMIKEAYRLNKHQMPTGLDVVFMPDREWNHDYDLRAIEDCMKRIAFRLARRIEAGRT